MKCTNFISLPVACITGLLLLSTSCNTDKSKKDSAEAAKPAVRTTLFDKSLPEVKQLVDGRWALLSGKNATQECEFEDTFITFKGDQYIWTSEGVDEPGELNWRQAPTGSGYDAFVMDVFYANHPSYPLAISGDTLYIQDMSDTLYKYTLVRKGK